MNNPQNRVEFIGWLGADPEFRVSKSGTKITKLSIVTSEHFQDEEGRRRHETNWQ